MTATTSFPYRSLQTFLVRNTLPQEDHVSPRRVTNPPRTQRTSAEDATTTVASRNNNNNNNNNYNKDSSYNNNNKDSSNNNNNNNNNNKDCDNFERHRWIRKMRLWDERRGEERRGDDMGLTHCWVSRPREKFHWCRLGTWSVNSK